METEVKEEQKDQDQEENDESDVEEQVESGSVLFVKNLNFDSTEESLTKVRKISTVFTRRILQRDCDRRLRLPCASLTNINEMKRV